MKRRDKASEIAVIAGCTLLTVYFAILIAPAVTDNLFSTLENLNTVLENPLYLRLCERTGKVVLVFLMIEMSVFAYIFASRRNTRQGEEHGSARIKEPREVLRLISDKVYEKNRILTQNLRLSVIGKKIKLSLNTLVIGGMGAGKSFFTLIPNLLQANTSFVVTDPSKELVRKVGWFLRHIRGYDVKVLDLEEPEISAKYNFFSYIENEDDILRIVNMIFAATVDSKKRGSNQDPMWENMAKDYLQALIALLWYRGLSEEQNIETLIWLLDEDVLKEDEHHNRIPTCVMAMMEDLELRMPGNLATRSYRSATDGEVVTIRGVKSTLRGRIGKFLLPSIQALMSRDELELDKIGERKTALFLVVPSEEGSFNFIISMLYAQLFPILYRKARAQKNNRLPVPVQFLIDEMPNFVMPEDFVSYLTTSRKHDISYMMYIQELGQLEKLFPEKQFQTVSGTCNTIVYLGGSGQETNKAISAWIGQETITGYSYNHSYGRNASYSKNEQLVKREILTADEIDTKIGDDKALVYIKGQGWFLDQKNDPTKHNSYKYTAGEKEGQIYDYSGRENVRNRLSPLRNLSDQERKADIVIDLDRLDTNKLKETISIEILEE
ncbi:VirD4-like conjugal transfer protein, CD1115 family [Ihubacter sp. mB4P-1]|uniref:VirD4-like conjugal transfer protein, CD1115 family n=1 Tax=Ihubacter sp. mB4P-1 TaxID=3242370 RepID=UPI003C7B0B50